MKLMKDIIKPTSHRLFKPAYLNTPVSVAQYRAEKYKKLRGLGMRPFDAYQKSRR